MPVYKDKEKGTWYYRVYIFDEFGKKKQINKYGFKSKNDAKNAEQHDILNSNYINELRQSNFDTSITFQELYNIYIKDKRQTLKPKSYISYKSIFENHILPFFKDYKLYEIDNRTYIYWKDYILNKGFSYKYNSCLHICMVNILNYAVNFYGLKENIASKVKNFSSNNYIPKVDFWTYEEFQQFINVVDEEEYRTFFILMYFTGLRLGECLALTWEDYINNYIDINKNISRGEGNNYLITTPKTLSSIRKVQLDNYTISALNNHKIKCQRRKDFNEKQFIFGGNKPLARTTIATRKNEYCKKANIKRIRIHDLRHSNASLLLSRGVPITVISKRLGHKDITTTLNKYSHLVPLDEDRAINILNGMEK